MSELINRPYDHMEMRKILLHNYVKYGTLDELLDDDLRHFDLERFVINIDSMLESYNIFMKEPGDNDAKLDYNDTIIVISSLVMNMVAHYRSYFIKRYKLYPSIYIVSNLQNCKYKVTLTALAIVSELIKYVDNAYFINLAGKKCIVPKKSDMLGSTALIRSIITGHNSMILTRNIVDHQLLQSGVYVIYNRHGSNKPRISDINNWQDLFKVITYKKEVSANYIKIFLSVAGWKNEIPKFVTPTKLISELSRMINDHAILKTAYVDYEEFLEDVNRYYRDNDIKRDGYKDELNAAIDNYNKFILPQYQSPSIKSTIDSFIINNNQREVFEKMNAKYYSGENSLNFIGLQSGRPDKDVLYL